MLADIIKKIKSAPKEPGIYIFYNNRIPLYVGKASNLKNRLKSYLMITDLKTKSLHQEANALKIIPLRSNIEALITESQYIKTLKPRYNILWRDDSSYSYVFITRDVFPKIFIGHATDRGRFYRDSRSIGPFTDTAALKTVLRLLRKYFPYCTCAPHLRICLNAQINNCLGYCCNKQAVPSQKEKLAYKKNVGSVTAILTGKNKNFVKKLIDPYELLILDKIWQHEPYLDNKRRIFPIEQHANYLLNGKNLRVECYDNSHLSGKEAVGAMTAWQEANDAWIPNKSMWRKFKMRGSYTEDDPRMMHEMVSRRLNHPEWPYPNYIIIDGGITQLRAAQKAVREKKLTIQVVAFPKPQQRLIGIDNPPSLLKTLAPRAIAETHNFVIRYHRKVRRKRFLI